MQQTFATDLGLIIDEELSRTFGAHVASGPLGSVARSSAAAALVRTINMDAVSRMVEVAGLVGRAVVEAFSTTQDAEVTGAFSIPALERFRTGLAKRAAEQLHEVRSEYLLGRRGDTPALHLLGRTRAMYEFVRVTLGVRMHGVRNLAKFADGAGADERTIGANVSRIYEVSFAAILDGQNWMLLHRPSSMGVLRL
jgi:phenylalanine ammonia-lyase